MKETSAKKKFPAKKDVKENTFPVVAIGASAGGLEAMMELLKYLPADTGMAYIYVQHLSPDHKSLLTEILSKKTKMKVQEIDDMDKIQPDNVFVIPYNKGIEVTDGHIKLIPRSENSMAISIDILFSSLALAQKERVIGIVLSGSASDGTVGMKDIKHEGGLTFAQDDTAKFTSMPHSAIASGCVDYILSPKEIALELARLSKHPFVKTNGAKKKNEELIDNNDPDLKLILDQLQKRTGVDFSAYKMNTVKRRIIRRMLLHKISTLRQYAKLLTEKNEVVDILYQDLLINVTSFFRDTDTHKYLKGILFPKLLKRKKAGESLRIWVPACATGEEAYSVAMILLEIEGSENTDIPVQIFATDLSGNAISKARIGVYTKLELEAVSPKRIQRFFTNADGSFRVNKAVRDMCVFAQHNILSDPPFSRLDFISCCNLFIYLDTAAQKKAVNTFHYALNNGGFLMLGKSENISQSAHLFTITNKKYKIFSRNINSGFQRLPELSPRSVQQAASAKSGIAVNRNRPQRDISYNHQQLDNAIDGVLISDFMPASVVINHQMEIVQFRGTTDLFLTHPKGQATFNIIKMARPEIAFELRSAIAKVIKSRLRIRKTGIEYKVNSMVKVISLDVVPLAVEWNEPLILIIFTEQEQAHSLEQDVNKGKNNSPVKDRRIKKLEQELVLAYSDAIAISLEQDAFTAELQSAHEEVVSSNEELQTVNEELETSKEEIESANEELITTNQELQTRNDLLNESYEYSNAIVSTMHEPMLVLGKDLRVKSANNAFYKKFGVTEDQTIGVLLYDLGNKQWNIPALRELLEDIIPKNSQFYNYEVKHTFLNLGEKIMALNASRVIQKTHREQLILLIIADITEVRHLVVEKELREKELLNKEISERKTEKLKLEKAVDERTRELKEANESLEEKNTALLNMNNELEAFTYVSSHDLQEPLRKIQTLSSRILEKENTNLSNNGKNYFRLMQQSAERMRQLIQDLLAFSHISAADRKFEDTDLNMIVEDVRRELKDTFNAKNAVMYVSNMCNVHIIPFQFRQLLLNLISNALKFSKPGVPPHIVISSRRMKKTENILLKLPAGKDYCHISVADNGIGFEKEFSEKIFEVFQRLHNREEYAGTGIGLAIVKKIVGNHNGIITATSEINKGTTFDIYIPALV
jgi:two-component system CheB/CheR fusion protein